MTLEGVFDNAISQELREVKAKTLHEARVVVTLEDVFDNAISERKTWKTFRTTQKRIERV